MRCGAATASAPIQDIVNVSAKYVTTGRRQITASRLLEIQNVEGMHVLIYMGTATVAAECEPGAKWLLVARH